MATVDDNFKIDITTIVTIGFIFVVVLALSRLCITNTTVLHTVGPVLCRYEGCFLLVDVSIMLNGVGRD